MSEPNLNDPWHTESRAALLRIAEDWTPALLLLQSGPRAVSHHVAEQIMTSAARHFTHPLLAFEQVTADLSLLAVCVSNLDRFTQYGTWDAEDDDSLGPRTDTERLDFLTQEVNWYLFRLLRGLDPCTDCVSRWDDLACWNPTQPHQLRCAEHRALRGESLPSRLQVVSVRSEHLGSLA